MCGRTPAVTRAADARDVETLVKIARTSHGITRFYADPHFPDVRCGEFYATWIRRSVLEDFAEQVLVVEHAGRAAGYVTCHTGSDASLGSIA